MVSIEREPNIRKDLLSICRQFRKKEASLFSIYQMASLQISGGSVRFVVGFNRTSYNRPIGSVTFPHSPRRFSIGRPLLLRRASVSGESETDDITDAERDGSASASFLGFQLAPPGTTTFIYFLVINSDLFTVVYI